MKTLGHFSLLLAISALLAFPLLAQQEDGPAPVAAPPPPDNGAYNAPPDQGGPPPPDQQNAPDQGDPGAPDQSATFQTFYDNLAQQGTWVQSSDYGYVWQPNVNDPDWAPYTDGHWVYSDVGWTWASNEPWGWATYHYGRWVNLDGTGWCWVPGYTWAPAWVSWRYGGGYAGWAPLPPDSFVGIDYGGDGFSLDIAFHIGGDCDSYYGIGAGCYNFVPVSYIGYSNYHGHYVNRHDNFGIINHTTNVTNVYVNHNGVNGNPGRFNRVSVGGPSFAQVNAASQTPVQQVRLTTASQPGGGGTLTHNSLALFAPQVSAGASTQPAHVNGSLGRATVNRGVDVTRPLAVNRTLATTAPTSSQIQAAQVAQSNAPASAKIVTPSTQVNPILRTSLTTLKPVAAASASQFQNGPQTATNQHNNPYAQQTHSAGNTSNHPAGNSAVNNSPANANTHSAQISQFQGSSSPSSTQQPASNPNQGKNNPYTQTNPNVQQFQNAAPRAGASNTQTPSNSTPPEFQHRSNPYTQTNPNVQQFQNAAPRAGASNSQPAPISSPANSFQNGNNSTPQHNPYVPPSQSSTPPVQQQHQSVQPSPAPAGFQNGSSNSSSGGNGGNSGNKHNQQQGH